MDYDREQRDQQTIQSLEARMEQAVKKYNKNKMTNRTFDKYLVRIAQLTAECRVSIELNTAGPREAILVLLLALVETHYVHTKMGSLEDKLQTLLEAVTNAYINVGRINEN